MARLAFWTDKTRPFIVLIVTALISVVLLTLGDHQKAVVVNALTMSILAPVQKGISLANQFWDVYSQNRLLRQLNTELSLDNQLLREAQLENLRLRQLLSFRERENLTSILLAEVIAREPDREMNSVIIGAGSRRGVSRNMPVVTAQGVVGKVVLARPNSAVVQLLMDRNCPVSAIVQRSRVSGMLEYEGGASFQLNNVPWRLDVQEGDTVICSGLGGIFPKGLMLGRVTEVGAEERELFKHIRVEPSVDFNSLEEVFVILRQPGQMEREPEP